MAARKIGEILLERGVPREALSAAWEQKILFGDRLGTNLLAEQLVTEEALALALGEQHQVRAGYGALIQVDPRAVGLVNRGIAKRHGVVPHHVDGRHLFLLMADPNNVLAIDEVQATTRLAVVPVVVCEARMWRLLTEHYGISLSLRPIPLEGDPTLELERMKRRAAEARASTPSGPDLMDDEAFHALYASGTYGQGSLPPMASPPGTSPAAFADASPSLALPPPTDSEMMSAVDEELLEPLTFEEAQARLVGVSDRDEIARAVLRYALGRFTRACLLTVHSTRFVGWVGGGPDCSTSALRRFQLAAGEESVFSLVRESRAHYIGPLQKVKAHAGFVKLLGRQIPLSIAAFPILVKGRVVNVLYADNGHNEHVNPDVGDLLILAQHIARSYESLLGARGGEFSARV